MAAATDRPKNENAAQRQKLQRTFQQGNYKDAYDGFRQLALDPNDDPRMVGNDLNMATQCLQQLNRADEMDEFREGVIAAHKGNWRLLWAAAQNYLNIDHHGFIVAGKFQRGGRRGGGNMVNATERDRVRSLQLMVQALPLAQKEDSHAEVGSFLLSLAEMLLGNRGPGEAWRLQSLTDLSVLPDYEPGWGYFGETAGALVDAEGKPIFYSVPKTFERANSDGERWRWCLEQAVEFDHGQRNAVRMQFANFLVSQFGVQTMAQYGWRFGRPQTDDSKEDESGTYALHTLKENETVARLATGIKRFDLPDEFNYIKIYQHVADEPPSGHVIEALEQLAQIFENRRQYPKAADYWRRLLKEHRNATREQQESWTARLEQIVGNWGRFEPENAEAAGTGATVEYRFRNGREVEFTAHQINVQKLLDDVKQYLKSNPKQLDWNKVNIGDVGYRLVAENQKQYLGPQVAQWKLPLEPRENHFDKRVTVATPLEKAGAYLLSAKMSGGNTCFIVVWLNDTAIVKKPLDGKTYYFVADAASGRPVAKANVEFFGYKQLYHDKPPRYETLIKDFAEYSDADGQVITDQSTQPPDHQWLVIARTAQGRFAYLGFTNVWFGRLYDAQYNATKFYAITDRPVYRPDQAVKYKFWVRHAKYDQADTSDFAGQQFQLEIRNPKSEKVLEKEFQADAWGGFDGELRLPPEATLGVYSMQVKQGKTALGGSTFRVEEYKKPEFEVTIDAPKEPVMLGEKAQATITAKYYFGSPVTHAKVKYKVHRTAQTQQWYPPGPWDWFYGPGYWWFAYDYVWYPGWREWGCRRPLPFWWPHMQQPPELVEEQEVPIGADGTVKIEIDTAVAKAIHPDQDHSYSITAEVIDQSRRTIVGTGTVLVSRKPFTVYAWIDRGYYRVGDVIAARFSARTIDGKPVEGKGSLALCWITYKDGKPVETPVQTWQVDTNAQGEAQRQLTASQAGQYRLSYKVTDAKGHTIEGGYLFTIIGAGFESSQFRFNNLELIPDKREYAPGEKIKLQINTNRAGGTVLLFARPSNGVYLKPTVVRLDGKSTLQEIEVAQRDMPNFFIEAVTVAGGKVYNETKEIVVPPERRVLNVDVEPSAAAYKPGQQAKVKLRLTDFFGKPFVGSTVVAIYDKSVEYIAGGSNVADIKEFFWKWRRNHHPQTENNLAWFFQNLVPPGKPEMSELGIFGGTVPDDLEELNAFDAGMGGRAMGGMGGMGRGGPMLRKSMAVNGAMAMNRAMPMAAAAPMAAPTGAVPLAPDVLFAEASMERADSAGAAPALVQPTIRTQFADTALWVGALTTEKDGTAEVSLNMPENLTTWRIKVWGMGHGTKVGQGQTDVVTRKDLILRMQTPRFFVQTDEVVLSAIVHNYLKTAKKVQVICEEVATDGAARLRPFYEPHESPSRPGAPWSRLTQVEIPANGEKRIDWRVSVLDEGEAVVRMKALTDEESDAMEMKLPCYIHGMLKMDAFSGSIRPNGQSGKFTITVPEKRRPAQSRLEVRWSPTLAGAMVDALPYLVDYPYGCTEQTLDRFLPTVITQKILLQMGLNLEEIRKKQTNLNAQEIGEDSQRAKQWGRVLANRPHPSPLPTGEGTKNPVFDEDEVRKMVKEGVERLGEMQCSDGGWGWFSGWGERSYPHTTAFVVHGLQLARENDVAIVPGMIERGVEWLRRYQDEQVQLIKNAAVKNKPKELHWKEYADNLDTFVYMVLVDAGVKNAEMLDFLYRDRTHLAVYCLGMYGLALEKQAEKEKLAMILRNIGQFVQQDDENQTAWLNLPGGYWWYWYGSDYEAHAYYLKLLARTDPKGELAARLVKYLLNNRKNASYWNSTRDTAICIEAMADFLRRSGEGKPEMTVEVLYDGKLQKAVEITPTNLFMFDNKFIKEGDVVAAGRHEIELRKKGTGPLYYNGYMTNFTLEDFITKAGLEIKVNRKYYRLKEVDTSIKAAGSRGQAVDQKVEKYEREELPNLSTLKSGDLCEIELEIDSKNDYEYLVFEDMKPAGFEPVELRSGYTGNALGAYMEFRDNRVVMFVRTLARGKHSVSYRMRAEIPGQFSALPTRVWAMYAPELKANSEEIKLKVAD